jgi:hypothetical protein
MWESGAGSPQKCPEGVIELIEKCRLIIGGGVYFSALDLCQIEYNGT